MVDEQPLSDGDASPLMNPNSDGTDGDEDISGPDPELPDDDPVLDEDLENWN